MYFIGLGLVAFGLLSLLVLFLTVTISKKPEEGVTHHRPFIQPGPEISSAAAMPPLVRVEMDSGSPAAAPEPRATGATLHDSIGKATVESTRPEGSVPVYEEHRSMLSVPRANDHQIAVAGALYLDHARNLSILSLRGLEDLSPRYFNDFKRAGKGNLICEQAGFFFKSGHSSFTFGSSELEQIVFFEKGVALVPSNARSPIAIFLTDEADRVKSFIRDRHVRA